MTPFSNLGAVDADPLIAIMTAFRSDPSPGKVDLGVGVFRDDTGATPIMHTVLQAETRLLASQTAKSYIGPRGKSGIQRGRTALASGPAR